MKEIGGYFELEELCGEPFYPDLVPLNLGRTALLYLMKVLGSKKLTVPYFLCDSVTDACKSHGISLSYYHVDADFLPLLDRELEADEYLYLVNFYGQLTDANILCFAQKYRRIIADYTHSFFQKPLPHVPTIYSCRKYFGLPDGAYASLPKGLPAQVPVLTEDCSGRRMEHILGRYEHGASDFYESMLDTARSFESEPPKSMSRLTQNLLRGIPYDKVREKRQTNYSFLAKRLDFVNPLSLRVPEGPFCYPFYHKDGQALKKALARQGIFVPTYWNCVIDAMPPESLAYDYAANILPLPCDQRYSQEDMAVVAEVLLAQIEKTGEIV